MAARIIRHNPHPMPQFGDIRALKWGYAANGSQGGRLSATMNQNAIFGPFLSVMLLTLLVWLYMYSKRIPFLQRGKVNLNELTPGELARMSPPAVANPSDNLKNLFELPTLFYALALYLFVTNKVDSIYLIAAWIFAGFRVLHSAMHCTVNIVILRFWLYFISATALWFMLVRAACSALT